MTIFEKIPSVGWEGYMSETFLRATPWLDVRNERRLLAIAGRTKSICFLEVVHMFYMHKYERYTAVCFIRSLLSAPGMCTSL